MTASSSVIRLRALGPADLKDADGGTALSVLSRPKLLALLTYLASAPVGTFLRRDSLLPLLWSNLDQQRGRQALRQALYHLRRSLGNDVIVGRGDEEVALQGDALWFDASEFEAALERGQLDAALDLYGGPFMEGFHLPGAETFERWLDQRRADLHRLATDAALRLAEQAEESGEGAKSAVLAERAIRFGPLDERVMSDVLQLFDRLGDRSRAVREFEAFARRLDSELGLEPSPETVALIESIRERASVSPAISPEQERSVASHLAPRDGQDRARDDELRGQGSEDPRPAMRRPTDRRAPRIIALVAGVAAVSLVTWALSHRVPPQTITTIPSAPDRPSIAVLPLDNLSGDPANLALVNGIHEDILTQLYKVADLRPISRTSVMEYANASRNLKLIASELGVTYVLEGGVQEADGRVRINVQLIDARTDEHVWAETYERDMTAAGVFAIQSDIAGHVARSLRSRLSDDEARRISYLPTANDEAYEAYLTARDYRRRWRLGEEEQRVAIQMYERAIDLEPGFALAYADLAEFLARVCWVYGCPAGTLERVDGLASTALRLEPNLAQAHIARGSHYYYALEDFDAALESFATALRLEPGNSDAHARAALIYARTGDLEAARSHGLEAVRLSPRESDRFDFLGLLSLLDREWEKAEGYFERSSVLAPEVFYSAYWLTWAILSSGDSARAVATWHRLADTVSPPLMPLPIEYHGRALVRILGDPGTSQDVNSWPAHVNDLLIRALHHEAADDEAGGRVYLDSAAAAIERGAAEISVEHAASALGFVYGALGNHAESLTQASRALELVPGDILRRFWFELGLAEAEVLAGNTDRALAVLERVVGMPGPISRFVLETDPVWAPLREEPAFRRIIGDLP